MLKVAEFIVDKRKAFYLLFAIAVVYFAMCIPKVQVENDISAYLPAETETKRGLDLMESQFVTSDTFSLMISNISYDRAEAMTDRIERVDGVKEVAFDDSANHYNNSSALYDITLDSGLDDNREIEIENEVTCK